MDRLLDFDQNSWEQISLRLAQIDGFKSRWEIYAGYNREELKDLRQMATIQSIGSSTRIEGATLTDAEVASLVSRLEIEKLNSREKQEVAGYFETLDLILEQYPHIDLSENNIKSLHKQLMQFSQKDEYHRGRYKTLSNQVVATYPDGRRRIIFKTTDPAHVTDEMKTAVAWTMVSLKNEEKHPLIIIGAFVYEFLSIHPFQDGNGRLSRLLTTLLLLQNGYDFVQYVSLEHEIENRKSEYYKTLMHAQKHRGEPQEIINRWMEFFLAALYTLTRKLDQKTAQFKEPEALYLNPRQEQILAIVQAQAPLGVKGVEEALPEISRNTIKYDLGRLVEAGMLRRRGKGRGTVYM